MSDEHNETPTKNLRKSSEDEPQTTPPPKGDREETPTTRLRRALPEEVPTETTEGTEEGGQEQRPTLTGRQRLVMVLWPPRVTRAQLIVALLLFGLGFGLAIQVALQQRQRQRPARRTSGRSRTHPR